MKARSDKKNERKQITIVPVDEKLLEDVNGGRTWGWENGGWNIPDAVVAGPPLPIGPAGPLG